MSLATEVREQIRRFVGGLVSSDDLSDWLDAHALAIHSSGDSHLRRLMDLTFSLLEDVFQEQRTTDDARLVLLSEIPITPSFEGLTAETLRTIATTATLLTIEMPRPTSEAATVVLTEQAYTGDPVLPH